MPRIELKVQLKTGTSKFASTNYRLLFAHEFAKDFNGTQAVVRAGYQGTNPTQAASELLSYPDVKAVVSKLVAERTDRLQIAADDIARYWFKLATADARDLCPVIVSCCRYCYGIDHQYQFTLNEMRTQRQQHQLIQLKKKKPEDRVEFDELGGDGYDFTHKPLADCPECHGVGIATIVPVDVTKLSDQAALLYDGYKIGKDGTVEIKVRDRSRAMDSLTEILGLGKKRRILEHNPEDMSDEEIDSALESALRRKLISPDQIKQVELIEQDS